MKNRTQEEYEEAQVYSRADDENRRGSTTAGHGDLRESKLNLLIR